MRVSIYYKGGVAILPNNDFIISILNLEEDDIEELDSHFEDSKIIIDLKLKDRHPDCPYCHGKTVIKDYKKVKIIIGDLNNNEVIRKEDTSAKIVIELSLKEAISVQRTPMYHGQP